MGSLGNHAEIVNAGRVNRIRAELCAYMDQHRWLAEHNANSWAIINELRPRQRSRAETSHIVERMRRLRLTYMQIELNQSALGLHTFEGASYG